MRGYYGNSSLIGADVEEGAADRSLARLESDRNTAFTVAQSIPSNFIGLQILQPVDARGRHLDDPSDWKAVAFPSRALLDTWFMNTTYETRSPGYSYVVMAIDKTQPMTVSRPDGTLAPVAALEKTLNVPKSEVRATSDYILMGPMLAGALGGAYFAEKRPVVGGLLGGAIGTLVGAVLSRLGA